MADDNLHQIEDRNPERAVFTDRLLKAIVWNGKRVGPDGTLIAGTKVNLDPGKRRVVWDAWTDENGHATGLCIKVSETGAKTFCVTRRVAGALRPTKYTIGRYDRGDVTLADARKKAVEVVGQMRQGVRPTTKREEVKQLRRQEEEARLAELKRTTHTVKSVVDEYIRVKVSKMRSRGSIEGILNREAIPRFGSMAIQDVTRKNVTAMIHAIKDDPTKRRQGAISFSAQHALSVTRAFFNWAIAQDVYDGLEHNPCQHVKAKAILDPNNVKKGRDRILTDEEVRTFMAATAGMAYPWGPGLRLLFLSA